MEILVKHNKNASVLCAKDPTVTQYSEYLSELFPNSKFILMIRDARATVYSVLSRFINSSGYKFRDYRNSFKNWNNITETMHSQCIKIGTDRCLIVFYEKLVLQPKVVIEKILKFLQVPWNEAVMNHEKFIGNQISLSKSEKSSDQVIKPVNLEGLNAWVGNIPMEILEELDQLVPMMKKLGYDTKSNLIDYSLADEKVRNNTQNIKENKKYWKKLARKFSNLRQFFD
jgi:protein-tyrosine sulfotransferase